MNSTGKKMRRMTGLNRYEIHFASHSHKSDDKRRRAKWTKKSLQERG